MPCTPIKTPVYSFSLLSIQIYSLVQSSLGSLGGRAKVTSQVQTSVAGSSLTLLAGQAWQRMSLELKGLYSPGRQAVAAIMFLIIFVIT